MTIEEDRKLAKLIWLISLKYKNQKLLKEQEELRKWYKTYCKKHAGTFETLVINELF